MNEAEAVKITKEIKEILDTLKIDFWLESGALLGAVRDGRFIEWDIDIDIGILDSNIPQMKRISAAFKKNGYEAYYSVYNSCMGLWKNGISIDVPFWRIEGERAIAPLRYIENWFGKILYYADWILLYSHTGPISPMRQIKFRICRYILVKLTDMLPESIKLILAGFLRRVAILTGNRRGLVVVPSIFFNRQKQITFYGMKINAPKKVEGYLEYYFGEDWKTPRKSWNYSNEEKTVISKTEVIGEDWKYIKFKKDSIFA